MKWKKKPARDAWLIAWFVDLQPHVRLLYCSAALLHCSMAVFIVLFYCSAAVFILLFCSSATLFYGYVYPIVLLHCSTAVTIQLFYPIVLLFWCIVLRLCLCGPKWRLVCWFWGFAEDTLPHGFLATSWEIQRSGAKCWSINTEIWNSKCSRFSWLNC